MGALNNYSESNLPAQGTALKIWCALKDAGRAVYDLHYNPNLWGRGSIDGWGTWACSLDTGEFWCGWDSACNQAYLQLMYAPYAVEFLGKTGQ